MGNDSKRTWGKSKVYFCPINKQVWQLIKDKCHIYYDMPSYGLERKIMEEIDDESKNQSINNS